METTVTNQGKANVNGVQLHYEMRGKGSLPILCIPSAMGTVETDFRPQLEYFGRESSGFTIVTYDRRGFGSSTPSEVFEKDTNCFISEAKDAHALMLELSMPKYFVLGWSYGGYVSLIMAAMFPESIMKLVTWGGSAYITTEDLVFYEEIRSFDKWSPRMREIYQKAHGDSLRHKWLRWLDWIFDFQVKNGGDICTNDLSKIKCPTLILHGAKDLLVSSVHPEFLCDHIAKSKLEVFKDGKHNIHWKYHQKFNELVEKFLKCE